MEARYLCAGRCNSQGCDQPPIRAEAVESQPSSSSPFKPEAQSASGVAGRRRISYEECLRRLRDLYELGDLDRPEYLAHRRALQEDLAAIAPDPVPDLAQAERVLKDFSIFWR